MRACSRDQQDRVDERHEVVPAGAPSMRIRVSSFSSPASSTRPGARSMPYDAARSPSRTRFDLFNRHLRGEVGDLAENLLRLVARFAADRLCEEEYRHRSRHRRKRGAQRLLISGGEESHATIIPRALSPRSSTPDAAPGRRMTIRARPSRSRTMAVIVLAGCVGVSPYRAPLGGETPSSAVQYRLSFDEARQRVMQVELRAPQVSGPISWS